MASDSKPLSQETGADVLTDLLHAGQTVELIHLQICLLRSLVSLPALVLRLLHNSSHPDFCTMSLLLPLCDDALTLVPNVPTAVACVSSRLLITVNVTIMLMPSLLAIVSCHQQHGSHHVCLAHIASLVCTICLAC